MEGKGKYVLCGKCSGCRRHAECGGQVEEVEVEGSGSKCGPERKVGLIFEKPKLCRCGRGHCKILTSTKIHSRGRRFYCCPESSGANNHGCGMFEWVADSDEGTSSNSRFTPALDETVHPSSNNMTSNSLYARGYLDAAIRGSEQHTHALKNILAALTKMDVNQK